MNDSLPTPQTYHPGCFHEASRYPMTKQYRCTHAKNRFFVDCDGYTEGRRPVSERLVNCKKKGRR